MCIGDTADIESDMRIGAENVGTADAHNGTGLRAGKGDSKCLSKDFYVCCTGNRCGDWNIQAVAQASSAALVIRAARPRKESRRMLVQGKGKHPVGVVKGLFDTVSVMQVQVYVENPLMVRLEAQNEKNGIWGNEDSINAN